MKTQTLRSQALQPERPRHQRLLQSTTETLQPNGTFGESFRHIAIQNAEDGTVVIFYASSLLQ